MLSLNNEIFTEVATTNKINIKSEHKTKII